MTRKHFEAIAEVIRGIDDPAIRAQVALDMVTQLARFNPRLDPTRFVAACSPRVHAHDRE